MSVLDDRPPRVAAPAADGGSAGFMPSPAAARGRGAFVVVVGPDGVGKTTIARTILARYAGPTAYFHFLPSLQRALDERPPLVSDGPPPRTSSTGWRPLGWFRLLRNFVRSWIGYLVHIRPAVRRGCLVVGDRWLYGYLGQPHALKFYGPPGLASVVLRALPRPDLVVNLSAPADVIRARKQELTVSQIDTALHSWSRLPVGCVRTFDAAAAPGVIALQVFEALDSETPETL